MDLPERFVNPYFKISVLTSDRQGLGNFRDLFMRAMIFHSHLVSAIYFTISHDDNGTVAIWNAQVLFQYFEVLGPSVVHIQQGADH